MKVKISDIYLINFVILILINSNVFLIGNWGSIFRIISVVIVLFLFGVSAARKNAGRLYKKYNFMLTWTVIFYFGMIICTIYMNSKYSTHFSYMLSQLYHYLYFLLFWPIIDYLEQNDKNINKVIVYIVSAVIFILVLKSVIWVLYNYMGVDIVHYMMIEGGEKWVRNGKQRLLLPPTVCFPITYSTLKILTEKRYKSIIKNIAALSITVAYIWFVYATKAMLVVLICSFVAIWIYQNRKSIEKVMKALFLLFVSLLLFFAGDLINLYINSIDSWSLLCRRLAFEYYLGLIGDYKLFGFGLATESMELQNGWGGNYYFSDLGIISKFFEFGLWGIIFIIPLVRIICLSLNTKCKDQKCKMLMIGLAVYTVVSSLMSNDIFLYRNVLAFPFVFALLEYINKHGNAELK